MAHYLTPEAKKILDVYMVITVFGIGREMNFVVSDPYKWDILLPPLSKPA